MRARCEEPPKKTQLCNVEVTCILSQSQHCSSAVIVKVFQSVYAFTFTCDWIVCARAINSFLHQFDESLNWHFLTATLVHTTNSSGSSFFVPFLIPKCIQSWIENFTSNFIGFITVNRNWIMAEFLLKTSNNSMHTAFFPIYRPINSTDVQKMAPVFRPLWASLSSHTFRVVVLNVDCVEPNCILCKLKHLLHWCSFENCKPSSQHYSSIRGWKCSLKVISETKEKNAFLADFCLKINPFNWKSCETERKIEEEKWKKLNLNKNTKLSHKKDVESVLVILA